MRQGGPLLVGVARDRDPGRRPGGLGEPGAVEAARTGRAPLVGLAELSVGEGDGLLGLGRGRPGVRGRGRAAARRSSCSRPSAAAARSGWPGWTSRSRCSLPREFFWPVSWLLRAAIPSSVRCICWSTPASSLASASNCWVWAFWLPDSSISSDPCCSTDRGVARGEHARDGRRAGVLERRGRGLRHGGLRRPELGVGVVQVDAHLGQLGLGGGQLLAGLVELHADLVELRGELVDPGLDLGHGRLRSRAGDPAVDGQPAHHGEPAESEHRDGDAAPQPGCSGQPFVHVPVVLPWPVGITLVTGSPVSQPDRVDITELLRMPREVNRNRSYQDRVSEPGCGLGSECRREERS